jgi:hypothetical protein
MYIVSTNDNDCNVLMNVQQMGFRTKIKEKEE